MNRYAKIQVADQLLVEALKLPPGTRLIHVEEADLEGRRGAITLTVEHHSFPESTDGEVHVGLIPDAKVVFEKLTSRYEFEPVTKGA